MTTGDRIANAALTWLGTPYVNCAMAKGQGVDCGHLIVGSLIDAKLIKPGDIDVGYYSPEWHLHRGEEMFARHLSEIADKVTTAERGDFLLYQYGRVCSHGAILVSADTVIHAYYDQGVILSKINDILFYDARGRHRLRGVYRFRGLR